MNYAERIKKQRRRKNLSTEAGNFFAGIKIIKKHCLWLLISLLPFSLYAQGCGYYYFMNHAEVQMTGYNKHGKPNMMLTYHVEDVQPVAGGVQSTITSLVTSKKGKVLSSSGGSFKCTGNGLSADMRVVLSSSMKQFKNMNVKAKGTQLVYPRTMRVGVGLPDGSMHMDIYNDNRPYATVDYTVDNRKVKSREDITTPAGTWSCFQIAYDAVIRTKITVLGGIDIPVTLHVTEWFAPNFGIVKSETFNKKGRIMGTMVLTSMKK